MKKTVHLLLTLAVLTLSSLAGADQTINYPADKPFFSIAFPDGWKVEVEEQSIFASSQDNQVNMELFALEATDLDPAIEAAKAGLSEELKEIKFTGEVEKGELNGMKVAFINAQVSEGNVTIAVNCAIFAPKNANTFFVLLNSVPLEALKQHGDDLSKVLNSVKSP